MGPGVRRDDVERGGPSLLATNAKRLRKGANGSRECVPDDRLSDQAIAAPDQFKEIFAALITSCHFTVSLCM
jgi:hypothetical protein